MKEQGNRLKLVEGIVHEIKTDLKALTDVGNRKAGSTQRVVVVSDSEGKREKFFKWVTGNRYTERRQR